VLYLYFLAIHYSHKHKQMTKMDRAMSKQFTLEDIAQKVGAEFVGDGASVFTGVNTLANAGETDISFLANAKYKQQLSSTSAGAVIVHPDHSSVVNQSVLLSKNPHATFARVSQLFYTAPQIAKGIAPTSYVAESALLGDNVSLGHNAVVGENVTIGNDVVIGANTTIEDGAIIGDGCIIYPNVSIYHGVVLGNRVTVHSQSVIGSDGFGFANDAGTWIPVPQVGSVVIGDDTSIGASTSIDRGALEDTVIGKNCIIDNQVQIAHNCIIGDHTCICGSTGIAGSVTIGKYVVIAGGVGISGHISICDKVQITGYTMVLQDITEPGVYSSGQPSMPNREWRKLVVRHRQLPSLFDRVKQLEKDK
jgi:UDP-3-O-[3-hydroxymyristoyl] glucosamine N-acyltransferase